ncbi:MAG TPA: SRPBCC family protein [Polyangiaceae bacterium]
MTEDLGTLLEADGRWMLRFERNYTHPPARVWRMLVEPQLLARWFPARLVYTELKVGAALSFHFAEEDVKAATDAGVEEVPVVSSGTILELVPERCFAFDWEGETVRFEIEPDGNGSRLRFTHVFDPDGAQAPRNAAGWHFCLEALGAALAGTQAPTSARQEELTAQYGAAIGNGPATVA